VWLPPTHFFLGATHPTRPPARELPILGTEEQAILDLLWVVGRDHFAASFLDTVDRTNDASYQLQNYWVSGPEKQNALEAAVLARYRREMNPRGVPVSLNDLRRKE
jgi:hypothetical protein